MSENGTGYVGIDKDYFVSVKEVLNITAETGALETQSRVRELPSADVVKVVRCKDCEHHEELLYNNDGKVLCWVHGLDVVVDGNGYCNYGERKEQEHE